MYDVVIIGAGINGSCLAYELHKAGQRVLVLEQEDIANGGSGAAGAFINPKISKSGPLKELIEKSYLYSLDFYKKNFPQHTNIAPLLHISKYEDENEIFNAKVIGLDEFGRLCLQLDNQEIRVYNFKEIKTVF